MDDDESSTANLIQQMISQNNQNNLHSSQINANQPMVTGGGAFSKVSNSPLDISNPNDMSHKVNITFTTQKGQKMNIVCSVNTKIKDLFIKYISRLGLGPNVMGDSIFFLFNGKKIDKNDNRQINQLGFSFNTGTTILVIDTKDIIGSQIY